MKTDYLNLNLFDASAVVVATVGVVLVSIMIFSQMPAKQQANVADAISFLDIHETAVTTLQSTVETTEFAFTVSNNFLEEFNTAFNQVAVVSIHVPVALVDMIKHPSLPHVQFARAYNTIGSYAEQLAGGYQNINIPSSQPTLAQSNIAGQVLGAMIDLSPKSESPPVKPKPIKKEVEIPYTFPTTGFEMITK